MFKFNYVVAVALISSFALTSCFDDNYDLSDIDKTIRINVNDLVVPVNVDPITLSSIFDIKEGDRVQIVNGQYAILESGDFNSEEININAISLGQPTIEPTESNIYLQTSSKLKSNSNVLRYSIVSDPTKFEYEAIEVSDYIAEIDSINGHIKIAIKISFNGISNYVKSFSLTGVKIKLPKGLTVTNDDGSKYDAKTGLLSIPDRKITGDFYSFTVNAKTIDFKAIDGKFDVSDHSINIAGEMKVDAGFLEISESDLLSNSNLASVPSMITMRNEYVMDPIDVYEFSGKINYIVSGVDFSDIELTDIPDLLSQDGTDLRLANPQLYLQVTNPLENYKLYAQTDFSIVSHMRSGESVKRSIDDSVFKIPNTSADGKYDFCLSPTKPESYYSGYENSIPVKFTSLGDVLSGDGIPTRLGIELNPEVPTQTVKNFALGRNLGEVKGKYTFYAPLELMANSIIAYRDTVDGWSNEDLERMTITALDVNLVVSSNLPINAVLEGYPIDTNGNQINNVAIDGANIPANAESKPIKLHITGEVKNLDGIIFKALIKAEDQKVLRPDMTITVQNVRPRVSGYYEKEL